MRGFNYKKATQALNYLAQKNGRLLNKMKAIKLIWLADRLHLRRYARTITGDVYFALPYGPVPSTTRDILERSNISDLEFEYSEEFISNSTDRHYYTSKKDANLKVFSKSDIEVLNEVIEKYNHLDQFQLSDISHSFPEWQKYELALKSKIASRFEMNLTDFFTNVEDGIGLFSDTNENLDISKKMFLEEHL